MHHTLLCRSCTISVSIKSYRKIVTHTTVYMYETKTGCNKSYRTIVTHVYETRTGWTLFKLTSLTNCLRLSPSPKGYKVHLTMPGVPSSMLLQHYTGLLERTCTIVRTRQSCVCVDNAQRLSADSPTHS